MNFELGEVSVTERRRQTGTIQQIETKQNRLAPRRFGRKHRSRDSHAGRSE